MRPGTPTISRGPIWSRHGEWRNSRTSRTTHCGVTPSATSDATFSDTTVDISRAASCGVTQILVTPQGLARPKGLLLAILVGVGLILKF
jgi:hypothetical protein